MKTNFKIIMLSLLLLSLCGNNVYAYEAAKFKKRMAGSSECVDGILYVMSGMSLYENLPHVGAYEPSKQQWTKKKAIPSPMSLASSSVVGNDIYIIGGRNGNSILSAVQKYSTTDDQWAKCTPMKTSRWSLMTCKAGDMIYAFGGISGVGNRRRALDTIEVYDPNNDRWEYIGKMPEPRQAAAIAEVDGAIYIFSGKVASYVQRTIQTPITESVLCFDISNKSWKKVCDIPTGRAGSKAVVSNGKVFIVGGVAKNGKFPTQIDIYDPHSDKWSSGPQLSFGRSGHMCSIIGDSIYVIGGTSGKYGNSGPTITDSMEIVSISEYIK